jgi:polyphenol oxidase
MAQESSSALRWLLPYGVNVAYSTVTDGDQRDRDHRYAWLASHGIERCVVPRQVHGIRIVHADADIDALAQADGVVTNDLSKALGVYGADCPGVVLVAPDACGVAHGGWRGVAGGIVGQLVTAMRSVTRHPSAQWGAFIGPGISAANYEVDQPVLSARVWPSSAITPGRPGYAQLDVAGAIASDLRDHEITNVQRSGICTAEDSRLWSYRRRGVGSVQMLAAWRG